MAPKHIAHELLSKAYPPDAAATIFADKVLHKPLHLRPSSPDPNSQNARAQRRLQRLRGYEKKRRSAKVKPLSAKEKRTSGIYDIPETSRKYEIYVPLHDMWLGYMREILGLKTGEAAFVTANSAGIKLATADYHGAKLSVVRSRCVGMVGLAGIVVRDTKFTFQIITIQNVLKTIPKRYTIFRFEIPQDAPAQIAEGDSEATRPGNTAQELQSLVFELHGSQIENRATDRATKKFKPRNLVDL